MPKPYNYARPGRTLVRPDDRQVVSTELPTPELPTPELPTPELPTPECAQGHETVRIPAGLSFEEYCLAVGTDPAEARRASVLSSLAAYLADDPIGRASGVPSAARRK